jgi:Protein of unknown function (DUF1634)
VTPEPTGRLERAVRFTLLGGLLISAALLLGGLARILVVGEPRPDLLHPAVGALIRAALGGDGGALAELGLWMLVATPGLRVAVLFVGWTVAGDGRFAIVAAAVLALLVASASLGLG